MEKQDRYNRKDLRKRLSLITMVYLDELGEPDRKRMTTYVDEKLELVVDYYIALLKKAGSGEPKALPAEPATADSTEGISRFYDD